MSQSTTVLSALTPAQMAAMDGERIVKMGRELLACLGSDPDSVHGNIWPGNIYFDEDGKAVLGEGSEAPVSARTPEQIEYMAPEAFWENGFGRAADVYSIALVMYTAYNGGCLPFTSSQEPTDLERAQALRTRMKGAELPGLEKASEAVNAIMQRALHYGAEERYLTAEALLHDLGETDEALPSEAPDEEQPADPEAAAAAAATGMAGVSIVAELKAIPKEQMRPEEAQAGVTASRILMEQELGAPAQMAAPTAGATQPLADIFGAPQKAEKAPDSVDSDENEPAQAKESVPSEPAKSVSAAKPETGKASSALRKKGGKQASGAAGTATRQKRTTAAIIIAAGVLVIGGLIAVTAYSLGAFEKQQPVILVTAEPTTETETETTAETTEETTAETVVKTYSFKAHQTDLYWDELENVGLAVLDSQEAFDAAVAAAEKAGLENLWIGARYLEADEAPDGEAGWYWLDGTQLPENSAFWGENEPSAASGGRLMLCRSKAGAWSLCAVTREQFESGEYENLGCVTDGSGMTAVPTIAPTATPEPTETLEEETTASAYYYSYSGSSYSSSSTSTSTSTSAPTATSAPEATTAPTPEATETPEKYTAAASDNSWSALQSESALLTIASAAELEELTQFIDTYNTSNEDSPIYNLWLGAQYLAADEEAGRAAGWYWLDGTALAADDAAWAEGESAKTDGCKLMLRYVNSAWNYYAVTESEFTEGQSSTYQNTGVVQKAQTA